MLLIILKMFFSLFFLAIIGEPIRFLFFNHFKSFSKLDFIQICILNVYIGAFILYVIAILPFSLFNKFVIFCVIGGTFFISFMLHRKKVINTLTPLGKKAFPDDCKKRFLNYLVFFAIFATFLLLTFFSSLNLVLGSIHDESIHSLYVQVILENNFIPVTLQPYLPEGIIYPQGSHVIFAFASYFVNLEIPKVVFYVSNIFKALSVMGAYYMGRQISSRKMYSLGFSFVTAFMSSWPLFVTWGGNPFLVGFPLFLICLGMFPYLLRLNRNINLAEIIFIGLLFGYLGVIIISYLQTLFFIGFLVLIFYALKKQKGIRKIFWKLVAVFSTSLIPLSPFLFRFILFYNYTGHNIGVPEDFIGWQPQQHFPTQALHWAFENLHPHILLKIITIFSIISLGFLLWKTKFSEDMKHAIALALALFASTAILSLIAFLLPAEFGIVSWGHQGIIMSISVIILLTVFLVKIGQLCSDWIKRNSFSRVIGSKSFDAQTVMTVVVLTLITTPYVYYRFSTDPWAIQGAYNVYSITTLDDYNLMLWMKENLSTNAVVLVHPLEAGLFIPSVSHHKIVFPFCGSRLTRSYQMLVSLVESNTLNLTTYELLQHLNISHVFVGAYSVHEETHSKWVPELFLCNPNFKFVKNFGNAYLFEFEEYDPSIVFLDSFEYQLWRQNRWLDNCFGNGRGDVAIRAGFGENSSKCLMMTAQAMPMVWDWSLRYAHWVSREIFVLNNSEVALSFYLNASQGFNGNDTFAVFVSNIYRNQSLIVAANSNGIFKNYADVVLLNNSEGYFEFKGNESISALWHKKFNSSLPTRFILGFVTWDTDEIENIVYLDNIQVTSTSVSISSEEVG